jgi:hypothetical protein
MLISEEFRWSAMECAYASASAQADARRWTRRGRVFPETSPNFYENNDSINAYRSWAELCDGVTYIGSLFFCI